MSEAGLIKGLASSSLLRHPVTGVRLVVWGDDFAFLGHELDLQEVLAQTGRWYDIKMFFLCLTPRTRGRLVS